MPASVALVTDESGMTMWTSPDGRSRGSKTWVERAESSRGSAFSSYSIST